MSQTNPYESPRIPAEAVGKKTEISVEERKTANVVRNIRAICMLYIFFGFLFALAGFSLIVASPKGPDPPPRIVVWSMFVGGSLGAISAIGVLRKKTWGIPICSVISAFYLFGFPIGTILGAYFLLNIGKVKREFQRSQGHNPFASTN